MIDRKKYSLAGSSTETYTQPLELLAFEGELTLSEDTFERVHDYSRDLMEFHRSTFAEYYKFPETSCYNFLSLSEYLNSEMQRQDGSLIQIHLNGKPSSWEEIRGLAKENINAVLGANFKFDLPDYGEAERDHFKYHASDIIIKKVDSREPLAVLDFEEIDKVDHTTIARKICLRGHCYTHNISISHPELFRNINLSINARSFLEAKNIASDLLREFRPELQVDSTIRLHKDQLSRSLIPRVDGEVHDGFVNYETWAMAVALDNDAKFKSDINKIVRKDGTTNYLKFRKLVSHSLILKEVAQDRPSYEFHNNVYYTQLHSYFDSQTSDAKFLNSSEIPTPLHTPDQLNRIFDEPTITNAMDDFLLDETILDVYFRDFEMWGRKPPRDRIRESRVTRADAFNYILKTSVPKPKYLSKFFEDTRDRMIHKKVDRFYESLKESLALIKRPSELNNGLSAPKKKLRP